MSSENLSTRVRILEACWELLEAGGASTVRMSDIARRAGVSRQAVYLHFPTRAELLVATTRHIDEVKDVDSRLEASRTAATGVARLDAFIEAWGNYIPEIFGVAAALMAMQDSDEEAAAAWRDRMQAVRHGCAAAVRALERDGALSPRYDPDRATDVLWTLLSVRNWEQLTITCGWSQADYIEEMKAIAARVLVRDAR
jgi:AcrR family transcriptional regulator